MVSTGFMTSDDGQLSPPLLLITAINVGRFGTSVNGWGIAFSHGNSLVRVPGREPFWVAPPLPAPLEGGHQVEFRWPDARAGGFDLWRQPFGSDQREGVCESDQRQEGDLGAGGAPRGMGDEHLGRHRWTLRPF